MNAALSVISRTQQGTASRRRCVSASAVNDFQVAHAHLFFYRR
jgi:hypothetical protein